MVLSTVACMVVSACKSLASSGTRKRGRGHCCTLGRPLYSSTRFCTACTNSMSRCCSAAKSSTLRTSCHGGMLGTLESNAAATASRSSAPGLCPACTNPCVHMMLPGCNLVLHIQATTTHLEQLAKVAWCYIPLASPRRAWIITGAQVDQIGLIAQCIECIHK